MKLVLAHLYCLSVPEPFKAGCQRERLNGVVRLPEGGRATEAAVEVEVERRSERRSETRVVKK